MQYQDILDKLRPTLEQEGVEIEVLGAHGAQIDIRAKRVGPGVPIAFLVKAIEGTFRRYHPEIREVLLTEYDAGENIPKAERNPEFDRVLHARPGGAPPSPTPSGWLGLDLTGLDRAHAMRALEAGHRVFAGRGKEAFLVRGLDEPPARAALDKWVDFYRQAKRVEEAGEGCARVYLSEASLPPDGEVLWMPGRVLLVEQP